MDMDQKRTEPNGARGETQAFAASGGQLKDAPRGTGPSVAESAARGRDAIGNAASEAMTAAGPDLQSLRDDISSLKDIVAKFAAQAGNEAAKSARDIASNVAGQVGGVASDFAQRGSDAASAATQQAKTFASELEGMARRNPLGAMAGAVLVGVLIGMMGRRS